MKKSIKISVLVGLPLLLGVGLAVFMSRTLSFFDPTSPARNVAEKDVTSSFNGQKISFIGPTGDGFDAFRRIKKPNNEVVLVLGGSQLHTVVNYSESNNVVGFYANKRAFYRRSQTIYLQHSLPNMNANEALYIALAYLQSGLRPDKVVFGFVYDDLDDFNKIRPHLFSIPLSLESRDDIVLDAGISNLRAAREKIFSDTSNKNMHYEKDSPFEILERRIVGFLEENWETYRDRSRAQAWLAFNLRWLEEEAFLALRRLFRSGRRQSKIFISKRAPIRPHFRNWNLTALHSLIRLCELSHTQMLLYISPHPTLPKWAGTGRYDEEDFAVVKETLRVWSDESSFVQYADFQELVPWESWVVPGFTGQDISYFHFNDKGHFLLGSAIDKIVSEMD